MLNEKQKYGTSRKTKLNMSFRNDRWGWGGKTRMWVNQRASRRQGVLTGE